MKSSHSLFALVLSAALSGAALAADLPAASSDGPAGEAALYGQSVTLPRQAAVCAERIADYGPRFQKLFDAWHADNAARIAGGARFVHEQAARDGVDADASVAKLADADVEHLRKLSPELLARHCQLMLDALVPASAD